jgi:hypothetical protein
MMRLLGLASAVAIVAVGCGASSSLDDELRLFAELARGQTLPQACAALQGTCQAKGQGCQAYQSVCQPSSLPGWVCFRLGQVCSGGAAAGCSLQKDHCGSSPPGAFGLLPVGASLPTGASCAAQVRRSSWEPRPQNQTANATRGSGTLSGFNGADEPINTQFAKRVDGDFTGTTDEIIQWASCKWGYDEDMVRAMADFHSGWDQTLQQGNASSGACQKAGLPAGCAEYFGIMQVAVAYHWMAFPGVIGSTAFNLDFTVAYHRTCYEGAWSWLGAGYRSGDEWGCFGAAHSGTWNGGASAVAQVKSILAERPWEKPGF